MTGFTPADTPAGHGPIVLLGAGRMGTALLRGWLAQGIDGSSISVLARQPKPDLQALAADAGLRINPPPGEMAGTLVVAVKPQRAVEAARGVQARLSAGSVVVSIMAGTTLGDLRELFPSAGVHIRAMPNLPAAVGRGATVAVAPPDTPAPVIERVTRLLTAVGRLDWLPNEALVDAATALSGSGPAYIFYIVDCLTRAGCDAGLPPDIAANLARATVEGAGELLRVSGAPAAQLREEVTSPGGTTQAGLSVLMAEEQLQDLLIATVRAAAARAHELGGLRTDPTR